MSDQNPHGANEPDRVEAPDMKGADFLLIASGAPAHDHCLSHQGSQRPSTIALNGASKPLNARGDQNSNDSDE